MRAYRVMLGRRSSVAAGNCPAAPLPFRPLSSSVSFLGCHDTSPHAPGVRTNGGFCMDWALATRMTDGPHSFVLPSKYRS